MCIDGTNTAASGTHGTGSVVSNSNKIIATLQRIQMRLTWPWCTHAQQAHMALVYTRRLTWPWCTHAQQAVQLQPMVQPMAPAVHTWAVQMALT